MQLAEQLNYGHSAFVSVFVYMYRYRYMHVDTKLITKNINMTINRYK